MMAQSKAGGVLGVVSVIVYVMALIQDEIFTTSWFGLIDMHCGWETVHFGGNSDIAHYGDMGLTSQQIVGIVWLFSGITSILVGTLGTWITFRRVCSNADTTCCSSCNFGCVYYVAGVFAMIGWVSVFLNGSEGCSTGAEVGKSLAMAIGAGFTYFIAGCLVTADKTRVNASGTKPGGMDAVERAPLSSNV